MKTISLRLSGDEFEPFARLAELTGQTVDVAASRAALLLRCHRGDTGFDGADRCGAEMAAVVETFFPASIQASHVARLWYGHCTTVTTTMNADDAEFLMEGDSTGARFRANVIAAVDAALILLAARQHRVAATA